MIMLLVPMYNNMQVLPTYIGKNQDMHNCLTDKQPNLASCYVDKNIT